MRTAVIYDSRFGNSKKIARSIAEGMRDHSEVEIHSLEEFVPETLGPVDLLVIGGPTESHTISARMRQFTDGLEPGSAVGTVAATFDTRRRLPKAISGSAATTIARRLRRAGVHVCVEPESFFVSGGDSPSLQAGEAERAADWGAHLTSLWALNQMCAA